MTNEDIASYGAILIGLILLFIIIMLLIVIDFMAIESSHDTTIVVVDAQAPFTATPAQFQQGTTAEPTTILAPVACQTSAVREWNGQACVCIPPFIGNQCQIEGYQAPYIDVGSLPDTIPLNIVPMSADRLSFPFNPGDTTCTNLCDQQPNCIGVVWTAPPGPNFGTTTGPSPCDLIISPIVLTNRENFTYPSTSPTQIYLKDTPIFEDRVFLYRGRLSQRYWLLDSASNPVVGSGQVSKQRVDFITVYLRVTTLLNFIPVQEINDPGATGVFSQSTLTAADATAALVNPSPKYYIHRPGTRLLIPLSWTPPLYVVYI